MTYILTFICGVAFGILLICIVQGGRHKEDNEI